MLLWAVGATGCGLIAGLDDNRYDRDAPLPSAGVGGTEAGNVGVGAGSVGPGSGGNGGSPSGPGGAGSGGDGGDGCTPPPPVACVGDLAVPPTIVASTPATDLAIASSRGVFGISTGAQFLTLDGAGNIATAPAGSYIPISNRHTAAASDAGFAIPVQINLGNNDADYGVVRFTTCGDVLGTVEYVFPSFPLQAAVTGSKDAILATIIPGTPNNQKLNASVISGSNSTPLGLLPPGNVSCCASRRWAAGEHQGSFYVAWYVNNNNVHLSRVDINGTPTDATPLTGFVGLPVFVGSLGGEAIIAGSSELMRVASNGDVVGSTTLAGISGCAFASSGSQLVRACLNETTIQLTSVNTTTGAEQLLHELAVVEAVSNPAITWDGESYGVVWQDSNGLAFARVCAP